MLLKVFISTMNHKKGEGNLCRKTKFGYEIGRTIGDGTYSKVRLAYSHEYKKTVALKIIRKNRTSTTFIEHHLPREIEVIKHLRHPNIIKYFQCIETDKRVFIAMEFANSGTLFTLAANRWQMQETEAHFYFKQLVSAMEFCHSKNIAHRDLKLENLLLTDRHCLKVSYFSFARYYCRGHGMSETFCGSNAYSCPEILKQISYDPLLADVWSCGVILYALVTGFLPFDDSGSVQRLIRITDKGVVFLRESGISITCRELILKLLTLESLRINMSNIGEDPWMKRRFRFQFE